MDANQERQVSLLLEKIKEGNVALFIGAGSSIPAGLPSGYTLTAAIKQRFSGINEELTDFMDVCQDVEETPPYDSNQLHDFIKQKLDLFQITPAHKTLTKFPWSAIFTTNFDHVIETAYNTTQERYKSCYPISSESPNVNVSDRTKTYLFKLMGTVDSHEPTSAMVLTRSDYHNSILRRNQYLKLLADYVKSGTVIYIGYSFKDQIVKDIISGLIKIHGITKVPWSYMLLKDPIPTDTKSQFFFNANRIIPLHCDFEAFFETLERLNGSDIKLLSKPNKPKATLNILGKTIVVSEDAYNMYASSFDFLHEEAIQSSNCNIEDFLHGKGKCWYAFQQNWDFKRTAVNSKEKHINLQIQIAEDLKEFDASKNRILYLTGMPGCGKTVLTFRTAYDVYTKHKVPVLIFNKNAAIDFKTISSFIEDINDEYEKLLQDGEKNKPVKVVLMFDDVASNLKDVIRLSDFLISRGRSVLIIANGRQNEVELNARAINVKIADKDHFYVDENLNSEESKIIVDYLFDHRFITTKSTRWNDLISTSYSSSFFAVFYSLVHPSRKPLDEIIRDQFNSLSQLAKEAFLNICCFSQFNIPVNIELLVRSLEITYPEFYDVLKDVEKIIFEEIDYNGNVLYRAHHRIIAQKTIEFFVPDRTSLFTRYNGIFEACLLYNIKEKEIVEKLLIDNFSTKVNTDYFSDFQQKELFVSACKNSQSRSLKHHLALIELELGDYEDAETNLLDALDLPREVTELYKGESDQNILTSLGKLNSIVANELLRSGKEALAKEKFLLAEEYFNDAKHGDYPNVYAYHADAYMWFQKAKNDVKISDKAISLSKSLSVIDLAKDNLNENELLPVLELETSIWTLIGEEQDVRSFIEKISSAHNSANGYFIYASYYFRKASNSKQFNKLFYDRALGILNDALSKHPKDEKCLSLKCKILLHCSASTDDLYDTLAEWKAVSTKDNAYLLYHFARISFIIGYYEASAELFEILEEGVGMGSRNRSKPTNEILDETTDLPKVYSGEVIDIYSKYDGNIKVSSLSSKLVVKFRPITAKFNAYRGAPVKFNIGFSYRGPIALNIIKA
jgi:hypothetical protein